MIRRGPSARPWVLLITCLSLVYILGEYGFNAALVDMASSIDQQSNEMDRLALLGETLSGIGLAFLLVNLVEYLFKTSQRFGTFANIALLVALLMGTVPFMRWLQPTIIDHFVSQSQAEQRSQALNMNLFKYAAANGAIVFGSTTVGSSVPDKVLLSLLGPLAVGNQAVHQSIEANKAQILNRLVLQTANASGEQQWQHYLQVRKGVSNAYADFQGSVDRFDREMGRSSGRSGAALKQIREQTQSAYERYQQQEQRALAQTESRQKRVLELISSVGRDASRCDNQSCLARASERYAREMKNNYGFVPPQADFVTQRAATAGDAVTRNGRNVNLNLGSLLMNSISDRKVTIVSPDTVQAGDDKHRAQAIKHAIGHPPGLGLTQFKREPDICESTGKRVRANKINVPAGWCPDDEKAVVTAIDGKAQDKVQAEWDRRSKQQFGAVVPTDISEDDFRKLASVRRSAEQRLAGSPCTDGNAYLSAAQFKARCIDPLVGRQRDKLGDMFSAPTAQLADGQGAEAKGRNAVRALLVPPAAIIFSLIFSLFALLKFVGPWYLKTAAVVLIIAAPALIPANHGEVASFLFSGDAQLGAVLKWALNLEPWIYQFGSLFKGAFQAAVH